MPPKPPKTHPSNLSFSLDEIAIDNYCRAHETNDSTKTCPQWLNMVNLFLNERMEP